MKSIRQIIRQPLRSLSGVLLVALAVAVLCVSVSQTLAAANTSKRLNETFITVALPTADAPEGTEELITSLVEENPELFKADIYNGLASAYIPELEMDNYTQHLQQSDGSTDNAKLQPENRNYSKAMFEVKILGRTEPAEKISYYGPLWIPYSEECWTIEITAEIIRVIGLQQGYDEPTGRRLIITVKFPDMESAGEFLAEQELNTEDRYLVNGSGYFDKDWMLRCNMAALMTWREEPELLDWELERTQEVIDRGRKMEEEYQAQLENREPDPSYYTRYKVKIGDLLHGLTWEEMDMFQTSTLTVGNIAALPRLLELNARVDGTTIHVSHSKDESGAVCYTDALGQTVSFSDEEYAQRYAAPMMAKLEGTAEEFLAENPRWQKELENIEVNSAAFPIVGVESMKYIAQFTTGKAEIAAGRDFTEEELVSGAKVCIMAKSLAEANGLSVGDAIDPRFYQQDPIYPGQSELGGEISDFKSIGVLNVSAHFYNTDTTPMLPAEEYTIVGLYEQDAPWAKLDDDYYAFTPNTIFVPRASVPVEMEYSTHGMFRTLVVNSDKLLELQLLTVEKNLDSLFYYYDSGYNAVAEQLDSFKTAAEQFLPVGLVMYAILILLFVFLFPGRQGRELAMMDSMGSGLWARVHHVLVSCLGLLVPGTAIGTGIGLLLWQEVSAFLTEWVEADISVELDAISLWTVAAVQIFAIAIVTVAVAVPMARRANLMKRK